MNILKNILIVALGLYFLSCDRILQPSDDPIIPTADSAGLSERPTPQLNVATAETQKEIIMKVQAELNRRGFKVGEVNGALGPLTSQALEAFQKQNNLEVTGGINQKTILALGIDTNNRRDVENSLSE